MQHNSCALIKDRAVISCQRINHALETKKKIINWCFFFCLSVCYFLFQGADHPHSLSYKLELGSDQEIPSDWYPFATVQFIVHDTCASGTEVKSLGLESDVQPQKHVVQKAFYNCQVSSGLCFHFFSFSFPCPTPCIQYSNLSYAWDNGFKQRNP